MHPNPAFRDMADETSLSYAHERAFGMLCINSEEGPLISHVPFLPGEDDATLDLHLMRSNPILRVLPSSAVIAVSGPDSYISPDWYGIDDQVPTWNYVAVHLRGGLSQLPQEELPDLLDRQSAFFEDRLAPKAPWKPAKMSPGVMDRMMRMIVPCRFHITDLQSTWKLGQNKPADARRRAALEVGASGIGQELGMLSGLMLGQGSDYSQE